MGRTIDPEEMRLMRERTIKRRTEKRLGKLEGKYDNLEKKVDSGFSSNMEEVLSNKGYNVNINPMLFRPYALLRYTVGKAMDVCIDSKVLSLILRGIVKCGSRYPEYGLPTAKLNAG